MKILAQVILSQNQCINSRTQKGLSHWKPFLVEHCSVLYLDYEQSVAQVKKKISGKKIKDSCALCGTLGGVLFLCLTPRAPRGALSSIFIR